MWPNRLLLLILALFFSSGIAHAQCFSSLHSLFEVSGTSERQKLVVDFLQKHNLIPICFAKESVGFSSTQMVARTNLKSQPDNTSGNVKPAGTLEFAMGVLPDISFTPNGYRVNVITRIFSVDDAGRKVLVGHVSNTVFFRTEPPPGSKKRLEYSPEEIGTYEVIFSQAFLNKEGSPIGLNIDLAGKSVSAAHFARVQLLQTVLGQNPEAIANLNKLAKELNPTSTGIPLNAVGKPPKLGGIVIGSIRNLSTNLKILEAELTAGGRPARDKGMLDQTYKASGGIPPQWFIDAFRDTQSYGIVNSILRDVGSGVDPATIILDGGRYTGGDLYTDIEYSAYGNLGNDKLLNDFKAAHPEWRTVEIFGDYTVKLKAK